MGQAQSAAIPLTIRPSPSRLINVAARSALGSGSTVLIAGFVIDGPASKTVLIRGAGPALVPFGFTDALADPALDLFRGVERLAGNDDWSIADVATHTATGAFAFATGSKDAALVQTLAPGAYTVHLGPSANATAVSCIGLIEVFEVETGTPAATLPRLINLSTRAFVGSGQDILIPGLVIGPAAANHLSAPRAVLIRAVGPGLADFGVSNFLAQPQLRVVLADGSVAAENMGWQSAAHRDALVAATVRVGAFPLASNRADSAVLLSLRPGSATIQVSGAEGGSGVALVEVYEVP
jgi:hypothetical protein